ncbi:mediator of rna polymerase ii transcription subunit 28 [Citrus sinensis]|uniref:Mediator of rna polymerase ii transcription subunit 28 n=1 Tax=Citrus sinensis TaxID=2711 RepID=A0ACB8MLM3_CITSI|nr:mediator of rna polymerase ii transcription subunit 28 [Citrus sinensis]
MGSADCSLKSSSRVLNPTRSGSKVKLKAPGSRPSCYIKRKSSKGLGLSPVSANAMAQQAAADHQQLDSPLQSPQPSRDDMNMISCVTALEAALLPCLPARELQAIDRSPHPSHQIDVERHARDFMEAAKKLQLYFISLQREDQPTEVEMLRKDIAIMEEELKAKKELIKKQERLIQRWRNDLKGQLDKHITELERRLALKAPYGNTLEITFVSFIALVRKFVNMSLEFKAAKITTFSF